MTFGSNKICQIQKKKSTASDLENVETVAKFDTYY